MKTGELRTWPSIGDPLGPSKRDGQIFVPGFCIFCDAATLMLVVIRSVPSLAVLAAGKLVSHLPGSRSVDNGGPFVTVRSLIDQGRATIISPRVPAVAYCQGTLLRNEIEAREAGKLEAATDYAESAIADRHGSGEVAAKIQAHVIEAVA